MSMDTHKFGQFLVQLRKEHHLTQQQLAEKIHVTDKAISKWERGVGLPDITNFEALAEALEISVAELIQCQKNETNVTNKEELEQVVIDSFEIAKIEKRRMIRNFIFVLIGVIAGILSVIWGLQYYKTKTSIIGQAQATTPIRLIGDSINLLPWLFIGVGCVLIVVCSFFVVKSLLGKGKNEKQ